MRNFINVIEADMQIDDEIDMPGEHDAWERQVRIEKSVLLFCQQEVGLSFGNRSNQINYDEDDNEIMISPDDDEITIETLSKLNVLGQVSVACSGSYEITIKIKTPKGFDVSEA